LLLLFLLWSSLARSCSTSLCVSINFWEFFQLSSRNLWQDSCPGKSGLAAAVGFTPTSPLSLSLSLSGPCWVVGLLGGPPPACYDSWLCTKLYKFVPGLLGCLCAELSLKATRSTVLFSCRSSSSSSAGGGGKQLITRVVCRKIEGEEEEFWSL
jgi:hypothetical protein